MDVKKKMGHPPTVELNKTEIKTIENAAGLAEALSMYGDTELGKAAKAALPAILYLHKIAGAEATEPAPAEEAAAK